MILKSIFDLNLYNQIIVSRVKVGVEIIYKIVVVDRTKEIKIREDGIKRILKMMIIMIVWIIITSLIIIMIDNHMKINYL